MALAASVLVAATPDTTMPTESHCWLHLTDFHCGLKGQGQLWPTLRAPFLDSMAALHDQCGPWDAVLFTGDQRPTSARSLALGASTPRSRSGHRLTSRSELMRTPKRIRCSLGVGNGAASRCIDSCGDITRCGWRLVGGFGPDQPVGGIIKQRFENGEVFRLIIHDHDVDGVLYGQLVRICVVRTCWSLAFSTRRALASVVSAARWR